MFVDADFDVMWGPKIAKADRSTDQSQHEYIIYYEEVTISWKYHLQKEIYMSTKKDDVAGLLYSLKGFVTIIEFLKEMKERVFDIK